MPKIFLITPSVTKRSKKENVHEVEKYLLPCGPNSSRHTRSVRTTSSIDKNVGFYVPIYPSTSWYQIFTIFMLYKMSYQTSSPLSKHFSWTKYRKVILKKGRVVIVTEVFSITMRYKK